MSSADLGKLSAAEWEELEAIADRFAEACEHTPPADLTSALPPPDHRLRLFALRELLLIDMEAAWRRGEPHCVHAYLQRFPELGPERRTLVQLLGEEIRLRRANGEQPSAADYAARFPELLPDIQPLLDAPTPEPTATPGSFTNSTWMEGTAIPAASSPSTVDFHPQSGAASLPSVQERVGEFELLRLLGEGSFGKVYLARQLSLDRLVALKITSDTSSEARTLASLEHDHIVQVFSERLDRKRGVRLLCMQYVAGPTLERVIVELKHIDRGEWSGRTLVDLIDRFSAHATPFHPAALRDRELLVRMDFVQAVCWLGARLAEALAHAHSQGVLHRDVKPANVLLNPYGRPLLADFNVSLNRQRVSGAKAGLGGTLAYMAPEHLDACNPAGDTSPEQVAERADVYSLGVTLYELLAGDRPFDHSRPHTGKTADAIRAMTEARRAGPPSLHARLPDVPLVLDDVLHRCLEADPARRYSSAEALAQALEGCRELRRIERELPPAGAMAQPIMRRPFLGFILLALFPHLVSSAVNIAYNWLEIVSKFQTDSLREAFNQVALGYNLVLYPLCTGLMIWRALPVYRVWRRMQAGLARDAEEVQGARRRMLAWAAWAVGLSALGWLPGGLLFPVGIAALADELPAEAYLHFPFSFTLSGLIAMTYAYFGVQFVVIRFLYPRFWVDPQDVSASIRAELGERRPRLGFFQLMAGVIPLSGATLLVGVGPEMTGALAFRLLAVSLIILGMIGFGLAQGINRLLVGALEVMHRG
jgi:serine/threonine protein kinase